MHTLIIDFLLIQEHKLRGVPTKELDFKLWPIGLRLKKLVVDKRIIMPRMELGNEGWDLHTLELEHLHQRCMPFPKQ